MYVLTSLCSRLNEREKNFENQLEVKEPSIPTEWIVIRLTLSTLSLKAVKKLQVYPKDKLVFVGNDQKFN